MSARPTANAVECGDADANGVDPEPASELLGALAEMAGERVAKSKAWPDSPRGRWRPVCAGGDLPEQKVPEGPEGHRMKDNTPARGRQRARARAANQA